MFAEVKAMMPISGNGYDRQIAMQIEAGALDLSQTAEINLRGEIKISIDEGGNVTDESTVTDRFVMAAIAAWCTMRIGNPPNYDKLLAAYESMKGSMRISGRYTKFEGEDESDEE